MSKFNPIISINRHFIDKRAKDGDKRWLAKGFERIEGVETLVYELKQGHATAAGNYIDNYRKKSNFESSCLILIDVDESLTINEVLKNAFVNQYCTIAYTTASHQENKNGVICDRFRLIFVLPEMVTDVKLYEAIVKEFLQLFPNSDKSCKDASRLFYGSSKGEFFIENYDAILPLEIIEKARGNIELQEQEKENQSKREYHQFIDNHNYNANKLIEQALNFINPDCDYETWLKVATSLKSHGLPFSIFDNWSSRGSKYNAFKCEKQWNDTRNGACHIGTLFYIAKDYGFQYPKKSDLSTLTRQKLNKQSTKGDQAMTNQNNNNNSQISIIDSVKEILLNKNLSDVEKEIELEYLRSQTGFSSYAWENKIVKLIKKELKKQAFSLELNLLSQVENVIEREQKIADLCIEYSISRQAIEKCLFSIQNDKKPTHQTYFSLDEFLELESEEMEWIVPGLLPKRESLIISSLPKMGKTLLTIDLAFCVATGESKFIGEKVEKGKVLIVSTDQSVRSLKNQLVKRGFTKDDAQNLAIMTHFSISQMKELEAKLEDFRPDLVVIDSLTSITRDIGISENSAEFAHSIYKLKDLVNRYNGALILIHHDNKSVDQYGVGQTRGSTAITGAVGFIANLKPILELNEKTKKMTFNPESLERMLEIKARDCESQNLYLRINPERNNFELIDQDTEESRSRQNLENQILDLLDQDQYSSGLSGIEIFDILGGNKSTLYKGLNRLEMKKIISARPSKIDRRSTIYFKKRTTNNPDTTNNPIQKNITPPPPVDLVDCSTKISENYTNQDLEDCGKIVERFKNLVEQKNPENPEKSLEGNHKEDIKDSGTVHDNVGGGVCSKTENTTKTLNCNFDKKELLTEFSNLEKENEIEYSEIERVTDRAFGYLGFDLNNCQKWLLENFGQKSRRKLDNYNLWLLVKTLKDMILHHNIGNK